MIGIGALVLGVVVIGAIIFAIWYFSDSDGE